jgi:propanol-preferring alcohol dehydrogenase
MADDKYVVAVPKALAPVDAAPLTCAGVTTFKAVKVSRIQPGETPVIFGIGGLGHLALQYARLSGAHVIEVDVVDEKLELACGLGADHVINAAETDPVAAIQALGGADVAVSLAASLRSFEQALGSLRCGGRLVCVALPADDKMTVPIFDTVIGGKSIIGSIVGTRKDLADVFALHAAHHTRVVTQQVRLKDVNTSIEDALAGRVPRGWCSRSEPLSSGPRAAGTPPAGTAARSFAFTARKGFLPRRPRTFGPAIAVCTRPGW